MQRTFWYSVLVLMLGLGVLAWWFSQNNTPDVVVGPSVSVTVSPSGAVSPTATPGSSIKPSESPKPTPSFVGLNGLTKPATCALSGEIKFIEPRLFESRNSKLSWTNVDLESRLIHWTVTPQDTLGIGPNIFANLTRPNGSESLTVSLPEQPTSRDYTLTATIDYGQVIDGNVVIKTARCTGNTKVKLAY